MAKALFTQEERDRIESAVGQAESHTSGEIQVHIEKHCKGDVLARAAQVFEILKMHKTRLRNGVLFYLAIEDHKFAILGDAGINSAVPPHFWDDIKEKMTAQFREGKISAGLSEGVLIAGQQLKVHFPKEEGNPNELSNDISFGKE